MRIETPPSPETAAVLRRRAVHTMVMSLTGGHGWARQRADAYDADLADLPTQDVEQACHELRRTWTDRVVPTVARIRELALENQARRRKTAANRAIPATGITRTEWPVHHPACTACRGDLTWLSDENILWCHACNAVQTQDHHTGRVKLTQAERNTITLTGKDGTPSPRAGAPVTGRAAHDNPPRHDQ